MKNAHIVSIEYHCHRASVSHTAKADGCLIMFSNRAAMKDGEDVLFSDARL